MRSKRRSLTSVVWSLVSAYDMNGTVGIAEFLAENLGS